MDLSLIQTHLDNFVDTWEGWTKVFTGLNGFIDSFVYNDSNVFVNLFKLSSEK